MKASRKVTLCFVIGSLDRGGAELHLFNVVPKLNRERFRSEIFLLGREGEMAQTLEAQGVRLIRPWIELSSSRTPILLPLKIAQIGLITLQMALYFIFRRPHLVHLFLPASYIIGGPLSIFAGIKYRIMSRRSLNNYQRNVPFLPKIERLLHPLMTAILGNSKQVLRELIEKEGALTEHCGLVYNGVDLAPFNNSSPRDELRKKVGLNRNMLVMTIVANLIPYKGHSDLISALGLIRNKIPSPWHLLVVGRDDGLGVKLQQQISELDMENNITMLGSREDVADLFCASDIGLLTSHEEGFSNAILEGMAAGLPIIATDVGGNSEAVVHEVTGLICPPHCPEAIARHILTLAGDKALRVKMGRAARKRVDKFFSLAACVENYEQVYEAILDNKSVETLSGIRAKDFC